MVTSSRRDLAPSRVSSRPRPKAAPALDQNVEDISVLVDRAPKIVLLAAYPDEHLVHVPLVAGLWPAPLQRIGEDPAEAQTPLADALGAHDDPTRRQDQLNISQAQAEAVIEPDRMLDDGGREAEAAIRVRRYRHATACHGPAEAANLTVPLEEVGALALKGLTQPVVAYNVPLAAIQPALRVIEGGPQSV